MVKATSCNKHNEHLRAQMRVIAPQNLDWLDSQAVKALVHLYSCFIN